MDRRSFLTSTAHAAIFAGALSRPLLARTPTTPLRLALTNARCFLEGAWQQTTIGVTTQGTLALGVAVPPAVRSIDVAGRVVSPGFIDILADNSTQPRTTYRTFEKYKATDGVTTALQMHGGSDRVASYYSYFDTRPHRVNYGVSTFVMGLHWRFPNPRDRLRAVEQNLDEGALGVSHSLEYLPTPYGEVLAYAQLAARYDRPLVLHLRHSSYAGELDGVDEAIQLARESGARVHIAHLHSTGGTWHMADALGRIRLANAEGQRITCCVYPYSYWATYLGSRRFDEGWRDRYGLDFSDLRLVGTGERLTAITFERYRRAGRLVAVPEGTMPLERTVDLALREDFCMIGSDGGIQFEPRANSHPRGAGCFATSVRHGLRIGMTLEEILAKVTTAPRQLVAPVMQDRGILADGARADLVVFDPETIDGRAGVDNPNQSSAGISLVLTNGRIAAEDGAPGAEAGVAIRY